MGCTCASACSQPRPPSCAPSSVSLQERIHGLQDYIHGTELRFAHYELAVGTLRQELADARYAAGCSGRLLCMQAPHCCPGLWQRPPTTLRLRHPPHRREQADALAHADESARFLLACMRDVKDNKVVAFVKKAGEAAEQEQDGGGARSASGHGQDSDGAPPACPADRRWLADSISHLQQQPSPSPSYSLVPGVLEHLSDPQRLAVFEYVLDKVARHADGLRARGGPARGEGVVLPHGVRPQPATPRGAAAPSSGRPVSRHGPAAAE